MSTITDTRDERRLTGGGLVGGPRRERRNPAGAREVVAGVAEGGAADAAGAVARALGAGDAVVLKPAELTPVVAGGAAVLGSPERPPTASPTRCRPGW